MSKKSLILVIFQFSIFAYFFLSGEMIAKNKWFIIQILGFLISLWGVLAIRIGNFNIQPEVKLSAQFKTNGPYKWIRNPMYIGIMLFFMVSVISKFTFIRLAILIVLIFILLEKIKMEEEFLFYRFGEIYTTYKNKTYKLIPYVY